MRLRSVLALTAPIALALPIAVPSAAHAASPFPYHDVGRFPDAFDFDLQEDCGLTFSVLTTVQEQGNHFARPVRDGLGQAFFGHDNINATFTNTRVDTGDSFSVHFTSVFHEVSAQHLKGYTPPASYKVPVIDGVRRDGPYYEFTAHQSVHATVRDADGQLVSRERGVLRYRVIFNTLGDSQPGGDVVVEFGPELISGSFVLQGFCALVEAQLG